MQIVDRKTVPWFVGTLFAFVAATVAYIPYAHGDPRGAHGGTWPGLIYATVGSLLILFALVLNWRKRVRTLKLGRAYPWMQAHIWLGSLSYPLILFHAGFRWGGPLTQVLMWAFTLVVLTGVFGLALQQFVPGKLKREVPRETVFGQIDHIVVKLREEADALVSAAERAVGGPDLAAVDVTLAGRTTVRSATVAPALPATGGVATAIEPATATTEENRQRLLLRAYYNDNVLPLLSTPRLKMAKWDEFNTRFQWVRVQFPQSLHETMDDLRAIVQERAQLERQRQLHFLLHSWLLVHIPISYAMIVLAAIHAVYALKYTSIGGW